jgi:hypothetical protein
MVAVSVSIEKATQHIPVWLSAVVSASRGLARRKYQRVKVNDLSPLWPENHVRELAVRNAQKFIADMKLQGYDLLTSEADVLVSGPFRSRGLQQQFGKSTAKHHIARSNRTVTLLPTVGRSTDDELFPEKEDFLIEAQFLSRRVRLVEHRVKEAV